MVAGDSKTRRPELSKSNSEKLRAGLDVYLTAMREFVRARLLATYGDRWWQEGVERVLSDQMKRDIQQCLQRSSGSGKSQCLGAREIAMIITKNFDKAFMQFANFGETRARLDLVAAARNEWAHPGAGGLSDEEVSNHLFTMRLLLSRAALSEAAAEIEEIRDEIQGSQAPPQESIQHVALEQPPADVPPATSISGRIELRNHASWPIWKRGLDAIVDLARSGRHTILGWSPKLDPHRLYFLGPPEPLGRTVKKHRGRFQMIPWGYGTSLPRLRTSAWLHELTLSPGDETKDTMVQDMNVENARVYFDGHMCVGTSRHMGDPAWVAPYFSKKCEQSRRAPEVLESGISYYSPVLKVVEVEVDRLLLEKGDIRL